MLPYGAALEGCRREAAQPWGGLAGAGEGFSEAGGGGSAPRQPLCSGPQGQGFGCIALLVLVLRYVPRSDSFLLSCFLLRSVSGFRCIASFVFFLLFRVFVQWVDWCVGFDGSFSVLGLWIMDHNDAGH